VQQPGAIAAIDHCRTIFATQPLIVLAETADLAFAREALRAGAQDVVVKQDRALAVLARIILYAIERAGAEARRRSLEREAARLAGLVDAVFANTSDCLVEVDESGTIARSSPTAASLLGLATPTSPGRLSRALAHRPEAARLEALLDGTTPPIEAGPATFAFSIDGTTRLLEVQPLRLDREAGHPPRLLKLAEVAADFATEGAGEGPAASLGPAASRNNTIAAPPTSLPTRPSAARTAAPVRSPTAPPMAAATRPMALLEAIARTASWRVALSTSAGWGFLVPDPKSAAALARVASVSRDDPDVALGVDRLQLRAWKKLVINAPRQLPALPALELGYGTSTSRPHLDHFLGKAVTLPGGLGERWQLVLSHVPKGVYVPTLAKTIRTLATGPGKPALHLADLESDYRELTFGHVQLLILDLAPLKAALAKDGKAVAGLLARARHEGCLTMVRGASGPLAEALRSRLGIDLTVDG
jgi:PAS domain-containing protein